MPAGPAPRRLLNSRGPGRVRRSGRRRDWPAIALARESQTTKAFSGETRGTAGEREQTAKVELPQPQIRAAAAQWDDSDWRKPLMA